MSIELRTRTPLGDLYRSPLGVLGPGPPPIPPPTYTGAVENNDLTTVAGGVNFAGLEDFPTPADRCGQATGVSSGSPYSSQTFLRFRVDVFTAPDLTSAHLGWHILGVTSGAEIDLRTYQTLTPTKVCAHADGIYRGVGHWSTTGYVDGTLGFLPKDSIGGYQSPTSGPGSEYRVHVLFNDASSPPFIVGEDIIVTDYGYTDPGTGPTLLGTCVFNDLITTERWINYATCGASYIVAGTGSNRLQFDFNQRKPAGVTDADFLTWRLRGVTSGANVPLSQYGDTLICGTIDGGDGKWRAGARTRPDPFGQPDTWVHEYSTEYTNFGDSNMSININAARRFGGGFAPFILGEQVTISET